MNNQSTIIQMQRVHSYLQLHGSATTFELRHNLDVIAPAPRIYDLRHKLNINIVTVWDVGENPGGTTHKIARYVLKSGKYSGDQK